MDIKDLHSLATVLAFIAFIGVWAWAWSSRQKSRFDAAARQLFDAEEERIHKKSVAEAEQ